jgi:hypothetical protein
MSLDLTRGGCLADRSALSRAESDARQFLSAAMGHGGSQHCELAGRDLALTTSAVAGLAEAAYILP